MPEHRRPTPNRPKRLALVVLAAAALATAGSAGPALAAKGSGKGGGKPSDSSLSLVLLESSDDVVSHFDRVTFEVATTATDRPFVGLRCWQAGAFVYDAYVGYFPDYFSDVTWFTMDSPYWVDGVSADCTARLFEYDRRGNQDVLATTQFPVAP